MVFLLFVLLFPYLCTGKKLPHNFTDNEDKKTECLTDLVFSSMKANGWMNIIIFGHFPDSLYIKLNTLQFTFVTSNINDDDYFIEDVVPYPTKAILMKCQNFGNFEESLLKVMSLPYWHPHANVYLYYQSREAEENKARIFFIFWYYKACNVILIQEDVKQERLLISHYSPFISNAYEFGEKYGCWTVKKLGMPIYTFEEGFLCEKNCHNVTLNSKLRATNLGTCLGIVTHSISNDDQNFTQNLGLLEDKGANFHGYTFRGFATEVLPFILFLEQPDGTYKMGSRDGNIWNNMAKLLNFTIDLTSSKKVIKKPFDFDINIQQIFAVAHRIGDFFLPPIYQFDVIVVELDYSFAYKDSGVCFMARRADYETILFDLNTIIGNLDIVINFFFSFFCIWFVFCIYGRAEANRNINMDFYGKNYMNTVRSVLLINLSHPPKRTSFRIFLTIIMWSFFIINFSTQAAITSFFSALKRGREVNTFADIIEKGYIIEGMASPDVVLPDTEARFKKINTKLSPIQNIFGCIRQLSNDSQRFCLIDCAVGRYLERNELNKDGKQYLHIAQDRVHSHYLNFIFPKHSVITEHFNKYLMYFFEAGLIKKWEEYRFTDIKEEAPLKPLGIEDLSGIFEMNIVFLLITVFVFLVELCVGNMQKILIKLKKKFIEKIQGKNICKVRR